MNSPDSAFPFRLNPFSSPILFVSHSQTSAHRHRHTCKQTNTPRVWGNICLALPPSGSLRNGSNINRHDGGEPERGICCFSNISRQKWIQFIDKEGSNQKNKNKSWHISECALVFPCDTASPGTFCYIKNWKLWVPPDFSGSIFQYSLIPPRFHLSLSK